MLCKFFKVSIPTLLSSASAASLAESVVAPPGGRGEDLLVSALLHWALWTFFRFPHLLNSCFPGIHSHVKLFSMWLFQVLGNIWPIILGNPAVVCGFLAKRNKSTSKYSQKMDVKLHLFFLSCSPLSLSLSVYMCGYVCIYVHVWANECACAILSVWKSEGDFQELALSLYVWVSRDESQISRLPFSAAVLLCLH